MKVAVFVAVSLFSTGAQALHRVDPGEVPVLKDGEGLLAVSVDTSDALASVKFLKSGTLFSGDVLSRVPKGKTMRLYVVPAGRYQWNKVSLFDAFYWNSMLALKNDPEYAFEVKTGQITFPGELVVRPQGIWRARVWIANRSLPVIDWLRGNFPQVIARYPFVYEGHYPDPFPEFLRKEQAAAGDPSANPDASQAPPVAGDLPLPPKVLWAPARIESVALSPDGSFVAEVVRAGESKWWLDIIDVAAGTSQSVVKSDYAIGGVQWKDDRTLLAGLPSGSGEQLHAFLVGERVGDGRRMQHLVGPSGGRLVDLLPESPGMILYETSIRSRKGALMVTYLDVTSQHGMEGMPKVSWGSRLNHGVDDDVAWYADGHGRLRMAIAKKGDDSVLMYGQDGHYRESMHFDGDDGMELLGLSYEGDVVYALSDEDRLQRDLVVYDPDTGKVTKTLFSKPGFDIVSAVFDDRRQPIGVRYHDGGNLVSEYFDGRDRDIGAKLRAAFPQRSVSIIERDRKSQHMLAWVDGSDQPAQLYYFDASRNEARLIDETRPDLRGHKFFASRLLKARSADGMTIEAFVTIPAGDGKHPLVVMPHGGPIGVSDARHFNREVQFLASLGYGVLQVNFRGSEGYGRAFREAGLQQYGRGIEDDIDVALQAALTQFPLDADRMCMLGASYGGYSALYSAIRWPGRFRCVVSIAGVTDRALVFSASDTSTGKRGRAVLEKYIGNPNTEMDRLIAASPLYQYRQLTLPIMLVHGGEDARVDFEHTRRLVRMLNVAHRPPILLEFPTEGHGILEAKNLETEWTGIAGFLRQYLPAPPPAGATASSNMH